jgi:hypothetical protein
MPPESDRFLINNLLQDNLIFPPDLIYRSDDPNFGIAKRVVYQHAFGLTAATLDDYVESLNLNHYWKNLTLGQIKTAQALDDNGNVIYEVVYSEVIDNLLNNQGVSVGKEVVLPFGVEGADSTEIGVVYPNSLPNMRDQVIDVVGQVSDLLPRWMLSRQADGSVLGFTNAWVIAYTKPGESGQIAYNIQTQFGTQLNLVDFEVDRYELDNFLTKNWDRETQQWDPHPALYTRFDDGITDDIGIWVSFDANYYNITRISGDGTEVTVNFGDTPVPPFTVGQVLNISGAIPVEYNGNATVTSCTTSSFTFASALSPGIGYTGVITTLPEIVGWVNNSGGTVTWINNYNGERTIFDDNSLQFISPVDMYSNNNTTEYDKYLVFPKRNILE